MVTIPVDTPNRHHPRIGGWIHDPHIALKVVAGTRDHDVVPLDRVLHRLPGSSIRLVHALGDRNYAGTMLYGPVDARSDVSGRFGSAAVAHWQNRRLGRNAQRAIRGSSTVPVGSNEAGHLRAVPHRIAPTIAACAASKRLRAGPH